MTDIIILAVVSALLGGLAPAYKWDAVRRLLGMISGLYLLYAIAQPVVGTVREIQMLPERLYDLLLPEWENAEEQQKETEEWVIKKGVHNVEQGICTLICAKWHLDASEVSAVLTTARTQNGEVIITGVDIVLSAERNCGEIEAYIVNLLCCPCSVQYKSS